MEIIKTDNAPAAIGPYSQGIRLGNMVYTSGQLALDPATGELTGVTVREQAELACRNASAILEAAGSSLQKVVKTTCFLADMADFSAFNEVYARYFTGNPARSCVAVRQLPRNALCEIEAIGYTD